MALPFLVYFPLVIINSQVNLLLQISRWKRQSCKNKSYCIRYPLFILVTKLLIIIGRVQNQCEKVIRGRPYCLLDYKIREGERIRNERKQLSFWWEIGQKVSSFSIGGEFRTVFVSLGFDIETVTYWILMILARYVPFIGRKLIFPMIDFYKDFGMPCN